MVFSFNSVHFSKTDSECQSKKLGFSNFSLFKNCLNSPQKAQIWGDRAIIFSPQTKVNQSKPEVYQVNQNLNKYQGGKK